MKLLFDGIEVIYYVGENFCVFIASEEFVKNALGHVSRN